MSCIVLCADDYGQAPHISKAILALASKQRISAASCLVNSVYWQEHGKWLCSLHPILDIGLHFNLTEGEALSEAYRQCYGKYFLGLGFILRHSLFRSLKQEVIQAELNAQVNAFIEVMQFPPDFIDGHQHVHHFPGIRNALLTVYEQRSLQEYHTYLRIINEKQSMRRWGVSWKKLVIQCLGTRALKKACIKKNIPHNQSFAGIYNFTEKGEYRPLFLGFLHSLEGMPSPLVMCHPGREMGPSGDKIAANRNEEYKYLSSSLFLEDCRAQNVSISRFKDVNKC